METTTYKEDLAPADRPLKRKRITMACHRCRQKKGKCDGTKPICGNCHTTRSLCEWPDPEQDGRKHKKSVKSKVEPVEHDELAIDSDNQRTRSPYPRSNHTLESPTLRHDAPRYSSMASPPRRRVNDESISAPHPNHNVHPHPHNQSALDILLAAALPGPTTSPKQAQAVCQGAEVKAATRWKHPRLNLGATLLLSHTILH
ncbi:hypothetical protein BDZ89DRAFT_368049 [Hymenopellis radicata]|nr:hypothetical protein BDZ89DRAFT_368049 [Hymenopellis radicata]